MPKIDFTFWAVSPMYLNGAANKEAPELRSASVRGQLRYWLRALLSARGLPLDEIWRQESAIFGSTGAGSAVTVRLIPNGEQQVARVDMLPHRAELRERSPQPALRIGTKASLQVVTKPGVQIPPEALSALETWSLLGGLGKRSRRMFGAVLLTGEMLPKLDSVDALAQRITDVLKNAVPQPRPMTAIPGFPSLHPDHSWVLVGRSGFEVSGDKAEAVQEAMVTLFRGLLRAPEHRSDSNFGSAMGGRRASPLHAQLRFVGGAYYPVLTMLRSQPMRRIDVPALNRFMDAASNRFDGVTVWGGPLQ